MMSPLTMGDAVEPDSSSRASLAQAIRLDASAIRTPIDSTVPRISIRFDMFDSFSRNWDTRILTPVTGVSGRRWPLTQSTSPCGFAPNGLAPTFASAARYAHISRDAPVPAGSVTPALTRPVVPTLTFGPITSAESAGA
jgi:hypothetical protein